MARDDDRKPTVPAGDTIKPRRPRHHQLNPRKPKRAPKTVDDPMKNPNVGGDGVLTYAAPHIAPVIQAALDAIPRVGRTGYTAGGYAPSDEDEGARSFAVPRPSGARVDTSSIGDSGLLRAGGFVEFDFQKEWSNPRKYHTINEMLRAPEIAGMTYAVEQLLRRIDWRITAANDSESAQAAASFVEEALEDMEITWEEVIAQAISYQWFGFSILEILYKRRMGRTDDPTTNSKYDDGSVGWRRFAMRAQETLWRWDFDEWGNPIAAWQFIPNRGLEVAIPISKCWHLAMTTRKSSPEGVSLLQSCWDAWYKMTFIQKYEAIGVQRDLAGFPMAFIPSDVMTGADADSKAAYAAWQKAVTRVQADEQGSLIMPSNYFPGTQAPMYRFELLRSAGPKSFNTQDIVSRYALQMSQRLLADFLMTANAGSKGGSHAAHVDKTRIFTQAVQGTAYQIAAEFTRQCIRPLARLNGWSEEDMPTMEAGDIEVANMADVGPYITALFGAGVPITPELQEHLYDVGDFPADTLTAMIQEQADAAAKQQAIDAENAKAAALAAQTAAAGAVPDDAPPPSAIDKDAADAAPTGEVSP